MGRTNGFLNKTERGDILVFDAALVMYILVSLISMYGFVLFIGWWVKSGCKASMVYYYVMFMMLGICINEAMSGLARYSKLNEGTSEYLAFLETTCWKFRLTPLLIVLVCIVFNMSYRWFIKKTVNEDENC